MSHIIISVSVAFAQFGMLYSLDAPWWAFLLNMLLTVIYAESVARVERRRLVIEQFAK